MQLNCKVIKSGNPLISTSTPHFQDYSPFLANFWLPPPSNSILGRSYPPPPFNKGGSNYNLEQINAEWVEFLDFVILPLEIPEKDTFTPGNYACKIV